MHRALPAVTDIPDRIHGHTFWMEYVRSCIYTFDATLQVSVILHNFWTAKVRCTALHCTCTALVFTLCSYNITIN